ncbi:MAG: radical SAM protein, partial [Anaeroplasmataceae bacterium]|nr:radical SAM protein [Anaeroplasmataceae bacterium]
MKLYMQSLGCAKNQVDSEMLLGALKENVTLVAEPQDAELILLNTCAFIEPARVEAIDTILELAEYKKENHSKLVVCGCLPVRYNDLGKLLPEVDRFVTIAEYGQIGDIINHVMQSNFKYQNEYSPLNRIYSTPPYMRYIKISDGCMNRCAFCAIPLIRGKLKSRTIEDIVSEVSKEVASGVYEINLVSQDTTKYGYDLYHRLALVDLLKELVKIEGDFKIRLLYLYPEIVTDELIELIKTE